VANYWLTVVVVSGTRVISECRNCRCQFGVPPLSAVMKLCSWCTQPVCSRCIRQCNSCLDSFCSICSMLKYFFFYSSSAPYVKVCLLYYYETCLYYNYESCFAKECLLCETCLLNWRYIVRYRRYVNKCVLPSSLVELRERILTSSSLSSSSHSLIVNFYCVLVYVLLSQMLYFDV